MNYSNPAPVRLTMASPEDRTMFHWYYAPGDGTCERFEDTAEVSRRVDDMGGRGWFGSAKGPILHAGVLACAFTRKVEPTYDAAAWLAAGCPAHPVGEPVGEYVTLTITAQPKD